MLLLAKDLCRRVLLTLCMGLAIVFAFASPSSTLDKLQHAAGVSVEHPHLLFGSLSLGASHADHDGHPAPASQDDDRKGDDPEHMPGSHHHHHSDGGAFQALAADTSPVWDGWRSRYVLEPVRQLPSTAVRGPERPPKPASTNV